MLCSRHSLIMIIAIRHAPIEELIYTKRPTCAPDRFLFGSKHRLNMELNLQSLFIWAPRSIKVWPLCTTVLMLFKRVEMSADICIKIGSLKGIDQREKRWVESGNIR
jgi:hypothetical protein